VLVIGIAGGTGSGKTTVAHRLAGVLGPTPVAVLAMDAYYRDLGGVDPARRAAFDFDHPDALDWPLLREHLGLLRRGRAVPVPHYDFAGHTRNAASSSLEPATVLVVEGILALHDPAVRAQFDLAVYVEVDADLRFIRRLQRDVAERGRSTDGVIEQYLHTVRPAHLRFVEPTKRYADHLVTGGGHNDAAVAELAAQVRTRLAASG